MLQLVNQEIPKTVFQVMTSAGPASVTSYEVFSGKNAILFGVLGAFLPSCHYSHLPGYLEEMSKFEQAGIDLIACTSANDIFVIDEWAKASAIRENILFLSDGNLEFARAMGLVFDGSALGVGLRSARYSMWIADRIIRELHVEPDSSIVDFSSASAMIQVLESFRAGSLNS
jgi:peroxiredoxin